MQNARWKRPSCIVILVLLVLMFAAIAKLASGTLLRTPNPTAVTPETPTYDTDVPSQQPARR